MGDPSPRPPGTLSTPELVDRIASELGLVFSRETIRNWTRRPENPLPVVYQGRSGQAHLFDWVTFLRWYEEEVARQDRAVASPDGAPDIDTMDWHTARTISARMQARRDQILTAKLEGKHGEVRAMELAAEDRARRAVAMLLAIPSRLSPRLAALTDELEIDRLLDQELRAVCAQIELDARAALDAPEPDPLTPAQPPQEAAA